MVSFDDIKSEINTNWSLAPGQANPTIHNKDERYSPKYPDTLFLKVTKGMPIKIISQGNNGGVTSRKQMFQIHGVYATYALAKTSIQEVKKIITEKNGWFVTGTPVPIATRRRYLYELPCYELAFLQKGDW